MKKIVILLISISGILSSQNNDMLKVNINNLQFDVRSAGLSNKGDAVILLHGFPETSHMYSDLIALLSSNGYKVIAPDQRGYSHGARPDSKKEYLIEYLVEDIFLMADHFGFEKFHLVGHDWGASVGWVASKNKPERIITWTALSVPHLDAFSDALKSDDDQKKKSRYFKFFKIPFIPEYYFSLNNNKNLKSVWNKSSDEQINEYLKVFSDKNALKGSLNWYRANIGTNNSSIKHLGNINTTTQFIWGNKDMALGRKGAELTKNYMTGEYKFVELDAGHWLIQEDYNKISSTILNFINDHREIK